MNFYNLGGIRFQNIATNDAVITSKINTMVNEGWELAFVTSAVESDAGKGDGKGIFKKAALNGFFFNFKIFTHHGRKKIY